VDQSCCSPNSRGFAATFECLFTKLKDLRIVACRLAIVAGQRVKFKFLCCCNDADVRVRSSFSSLTRTELETQSKTASKSSGYSKTFPVSVCVSQAGPFDFSEALDGEPQADSRGSSSLAYQVSMLRFMAMARSSVRSCRLSGSLWSSERLPSRPDGFDNSESRSGMSTRRSQSLARKERLGGPWVTGDVAGFRSNCRHCDCERKQF
jgi:hypothetical protein